MWGSLTVLAAGPADLPWPALFMRWIHIFSACLAVGGPFFMRFILAPAARKVLGDAQNAELRQRLMNRWRLLLYLLIAAFLISGGYNYFVVARYKSPLFVTTTEKALYHALFGIKVILALVMFFLASVLAGRSAAFEKFRQRAGLWQLVLILLGIAIIICGGLMRALPTAVTTPVLPTP